MFGYYGGWMPFIGMAMMFLFWAGIILIAIWGVRAMFPQHTPPALPESPLDVLKRRYAAGEISAEEYEQARKTLS